MGARVFLSARATPAGMAGGPCRFLPCLLALLVAAHSHGQAPASSGVPVDLADFRRGPDITVQHDEKLLELRWNIAGDDFGALTFNLERGRPLIDLLGVATAGQPAKGVLRNATPVVMLIVGERDLKNPAGWVAFFDNPPLRAHRTFPLTLDKKSMRVTSDGARSTVTVGEVTAGSFRGTWQFTVYHHSPLVFAEAVVQTAEDGRAILYDAGLSVARVPFYDASGKALVPSWRNVAWLDPEGELQRTWIDPNYVAHTAAPVRVARRTLVAEGAAGSVAVFPPPHQYFYPLDVATNLGFAWFGNLGPNWQHGYGFGVQQPPAGDRIWVPWFNAPPRTAQRLGLFYLVTPGDARQALDAVARYTRDDRYQALSGYKTFTSHYHVEHTMELTRKRQQAGAMNTIPPELVTPDFVKTFKARGVDIVHLAEFHFPDTPRMPAETRLALLKTLHEECARLSDDALLVLPGEEPNVHLGGHWISFFPKPVYWVLNRAKGKPFSEKVAGYGTVYHVGSPDDVLELMEKERGLMWAAHPRIKGSFGFPDHYFDSAFYRSERFLGGAWKSMPVDLSLPRLGSRVLDLLDDMANRGDRKYIPGEVDIFRVEPGMESYAHMNINYLKLDRLPVFSDGWQPVLDALRGGKFFVSTGEVLIPEFSAGGKESGETLAVPPDGRVAIRARVEWTLPLSFAEIVSGDGRKVYRQRINVSDTESFGRRELSIAADLKSHTWVRLEVWDIARNGAFTQPIWLK